MDKSDQWEVDEVSDEDTEIISVEVIDPGLKDDDEDDSYYVELWDHFDKYDWYFCPTCHKDSLKCMECGTDLFVCECLNSQTAYCLDCDEAHDVESMADEYDSYRKFWDDAESFAEDDDKDKVWECKCDPEKTVMCVQCGVVRSKKSDPWKEDDWGKKGTTTTKWVSKCRHYGTELTFPNGQMIIASSERTHPDDYHVDWGLYAYSGWQPSCRAEFIWWPDYTWPKKWELAADSIIDAYRYAETGARVEVGCFGGHGRTGVIVACMAVLAGVPWQDAATWVWDNYCYEAIESNDQEWYIKWFAAYAAGEELPTDAPKANISKTSDKRKGWDDKWGDGWDDDKKEAGSSADPFSEGPSGTTVTLNQNGSVKSTATKSSQNKGEKEGKHTGQHGEKCDYCRYVRMGFGALADDNESNQRHEDEMKILEKTLKQLKATKAAEREVHYPSWDNMVSEVYCVECNAIWPCEDSKIMRPNVGDRSGDWEFTRNWGWQWVGLFGGPGSNELEEMEGYLS